MGLVEFVEGSFHVARINAACKCGVVSANQKTSAFVPQFGSGTLSDLTKKMIFPSVILVFHL